MVIDTTRSRVLPPCASSVEAPGLTDQGDRPTLLVDSLVGRWWVLHTRSRNEKAVATHLARRGISYYLPLVHRRRTYGGSIREVSIPLFPGYVFLCGGSQDRYEALRTNRIANILEVGDQEGLKEDLRRIERVVESDEPVDLYPRLRAGCRCRVIGGSLIGVEGVVLRRRGPWRMYVAVEFLGQSAELEIDPALLEVLD